MPRVKGGYTTRRRRKAVLKLAKGYYGSKHALYKTAHEQVMRSLAYAYRDRKNKKRDFRKLWIQRINAAAQLNGMKYSAFINGLTKAGVEINRKMLAEMAVNDAEGFAALVKVAQEGLTKETVKVEEKVVVLKTASKAVKAQQVKEAPKAKEVKAEAPKAKAEAPKAKETKVEAPKAKEVKVEAAKPATVDLSSKTVAELKEMAKAAGIKGISTMKKADLIEALSK